MSKFKVNSITDKSGRSGPVIAGVSTNNSTGCMIIPAGPTEHRGGRGRGIVCGGRNNPSPAVAEVNLLADNTISDIFVKNAGIGYTVAPTVIISNPSLNTGVGNFERGELVQGMSSGIRATVKEWDTDTRILKVSNVGIGTTSAAFIPGEKIQALESMFFVVDSTAVATIGITTTILTGINTSNITLNQELDQVEFEQLAVIGSGSTVTSIGAGTINISILSLNTTGVTTSISFGSTVFSNYALDFFDEDNQDTTFESNEIIESEADGIIDFSEGNPFGTF